jgi:ABC-type nitrate/sulfonate/bicarbonate transport system permease component
MRERDVSVAVGSAPHRAVRRILAGATQRWLIFGCCVLIWEGGTRAAGDPFFPPPSRIAVHTYRLWFSGPADRAFLTSSATGNLVPSVARMLSALAIATAVGVVVGLAIGRSKRAYAYLDPIIQFSRSIPPPSIVPILSVLFNFGTQMEIIAIVLTVVWPIVLNTADGARSVDPLQLATAHAFRLTAGQRLWRVIIPATLPKIFAGVRISLPISLILMVFSELMPGAMDGLGYLLNLAQSSSDIPTVWSGIVILGILGYLLNVALLTTERRVLAWHRGANRAEI